MLLVCMYMFMNVHLSEGLRVHLYVCVHICGGQRSVSVWFFRTQELLFHFILICWDSVSHYPATWQVGSYQRASGILTSPAWNYKHEPPNSAFCFYANSEDQTHVLIFAGQTLYYLFSRCLILVQVYIVKMTYI